MKYTLSVFSIYEYGQRRDAAGRPHQEDSLYPAHGAVGADDRLFIVCDGMGGHDAGEVASATVCEALAQGVAAETGGVDAPLTDGALLSALDHAYDALDERDTGAFKKMGTTMTLLALHGEGATIAHIGDSRVYHIRPGHDAEQTQILFVTRDHSLLQQLLDVGELTEADVPNFKQKNIITRAMQPHMEQRSRPDVYHTADIQPGDYFYLCTDGMLENTTDENIRFIFSDAITDKADALTKTTATNSDNHSAIVVHVLSVEGGDAPADVATPAAPSAPQASAPAAPSRHAKKRRGGPALWLAVVMVLAAVAAVVALSLLL